MSIVTELTDEQLDAMRLRGELVCQCDDPIYEPVWGSYQCGRCFKKISGT
jgi:hypothetical protein